MWESLFQSKDFATVVFWTTVCGAGVATAAIKMWQQHQATKLETELKMEMVVRGMSADEIERVITAKQPDAKDLAKTKAYVKK